MPTNIHSLSLSSSHEGSHKSGHETLTRVLNANCSAHENVHGSLGLFASVLFLGHNPLFPFFSVSSVIREHVLAMKFGR